MTNKRILFMKKEYCDDASKQTIPNLEQYTWHIRIAFLESSLNCFLTFFYSWLTPLLILGIIFLSEALDKPKSHRKADRNFIAVIGGLISLSAFTILLACLFSFRELIYIYIIEMFIHFIIMFIYRNKGNK